MMFVIIYVWYKCMIHLYSDLMSWSDDVSILWLRDNIHLLSINSQYIHRHFIFFNLKVMCLVYIEDDHSTTGALEQLQSSDTSETRTIISPSEVVVFLLDISVRVLEAERLDVVSDVRDASIEFLRPRGERVAVVPAGKISSLSKCCIISAEWHGPDCGTLTLILTFFFWSTF